MKKEKINSDKISGLNPIEIDYRYGDSFTRSIRKSMTITNSNGVTITKSIHFENKEFYYTDNHGIKTLDRNINLIYGRFFAYIDNKRYHKFKSALFGERYTLKGMIKDTPHLIPSAPVHGKSNMAGNIYNLRQLSKSMPKIDVDKWEAIRQELEPTTKSMHDLLGIKPVDVGSGIFISMNGYKKIILNELNSKSVDIRFKFESDEPFIRISNNNVDLTIKNPSVINNLKQLLIKSLQ